MDSANASSSDSSRRKVFKHTVAGGPRRAIDLLHDVSSFSRSAIKDAMTKGAVWLIRQGRRRRLRRATAELSPGDCVEFFYDPSLLAFSPPPPRLIADMRRYSVWCKPAGVVAEGTEYGDHAAMERIVAGVFHPERPVFVVHRLDREATGLMLVAHDKEAAARLSQLFAGDGLEKEYRVQVRGRPVDSGRIDAHIDGKAALTEYKVVNYDADTDTSTLSVRIHTGRLHQIRRHLDGIGHPVMGDPRYGRGNKNREGLRLCAARLAFADPFTRRRVEFSLSTEDAGF